MTAPWTSIQKGIASTVFLFTIKNLAMFKTFNRSTNFQSPKCIPSFSDTYSKQSRTSLAKVVLTIWFVAPAVVLPTTSPNPYPKVIAGYETLGLLIDKT
jgi:hypothetical protein